MTVTPDVLERQLADDIRSLGDLLDDESFCAELYRGLADVKWRRGGGAVAVSWKRAEELINEARAARGRPGMTLAQTGGEGQVSRRVAETLGARGWSPEPLDTSRHDDAHVGSAEDPPPPDAGARQAPVEDPKAWERKAHAEAEAERLKRAG
jgi:hypothetical protein